jgi:integrase
VLTPEEVQRLIAAARTLTERTMLMVLYSTGMRNAELRHLQVCDIDSRAMLIHVGHGKGVHTRDQNGGHRTPAERCSGIRIPTHFESVTLSPSRCGHMCVERQSLDKCQT